MLSDSICKEVVRISKEAGAFIRSERGKTAGKVEEKSRNSLVTYVDKTAEKLIVDGLKPLITGAGFITEEETINVKGEEYNWVIDPLDGTTNFIHGVPCFAVSIGLLRNNEPVLGVIYEVNQNECFHGWEGSPAFLNDKVMSVSVSPTLEESLIATGFPYYDYERMDEYMNLFRHLMKNTRGLRRPGSAAVDLAYTAAGRFDAFYEYSLHPWDVAAGAFLVKQAGGKVSDFKGENGFIFNKEIIVANPHIFSELLKTIQRFFP